MARIAKWPMYIHENAFWTLLPIRFCIPSCIDGEWESVQCLLLTVIVMGTFWEGMILGMDLEDLDDGSALCYVLEFVDDWNEQVLDVKGGMDVEGMEDVNGHRIGLFVENENEPMAVESVLMESRGCEKKNGGVVRGLE